MSQQLATTNPRSPAELVYHLVPAGSIKAIRELHQEGASLEWTDQEGKTPLILACMSPSLFHVAKGLIELGANVNAYHSGHGGGTPLHHAAKRGSKQIVELLLSQRAKVLVKNDDDRTPLDVARSGRHTNIVRPIENRIGYFSGLMREFCGPWFLEAVTTRLVTRYVWVVVLPCSEKPLKLEIVIYPSQQHSQPRTVIALWKSKIEEPIFDQHDPKLTIFHNSSGTKYRFSSEIANDKQQLQSLYNACKGIRQVKSPSVLSHSHTKSRDSSQPPVKPLNPDTLSSTSVQSKAVKNDVLGSSAGSTIYNGLGSSHGATHSSQVNTNGGKEKSVMDDHNRENVKNYDKNSRVVSAAASSSSSSAFLVPSAPPILDEGSSEGPIHYPSIDSSALDVPFSSVVEASMTNNSMRIVATDSSSCAICWDAPIEGACIPCGHMAGCMACLNKIKDNKGACPICVTKMDQVVRLHAVFVLGLIEC